MSKKTKTAAAAVCALVLGQSVSSGLYPDNAGASDFHLTPTTVNAVTADTADDVICGCDYTIMVRLSGKYITAAADGNVHQWEKLGNASQQWRIIDAGSGKCALA